VTNAKTKRKLKNGVWKNDLKMPQSYEKLWKRLNMKKSVTFVWFSQWKLKWRPITEPVLQQKARNFQ